MSKNQHKKKKNIRLPYVILLLFAALLLSTAVTYSRYSLDWSLGRTAAQAKAFYFTSDLLEEGEDDPPIYRIGDFKAGDEISFKLRNYADELRTSGADITYTITATGGAVLTDTGNNETSGKGVLHLEGSENEQVENTVTLTVPTESFTSGKAVVKVVVTSTLPYTQTLSAVFELYQSMTDVTLNVLDAVDSNTLTLTVTTHDKNGTVTIHWSEDALLPDRTDSRLSNITMNLGGNSCQFNANANAQYVFTFFKNTPSSNYSGQKNPFTTSSQASAGNN